jgi:hypothetical protein
VPHEIRSECRKLAVGLILASAAGGFNVREIEAPPEADDSPANP